MNLPHGYGVRHEGTRGLMKIKSRPAPSCPLWMVSYGDMMGLLLAFFVMLVAMSTVDKRLFGQAAQSIQDAFGMDVAGKNRTAAGTMDFPQRLQSVIQSRQVKLSGAAGTEVAPGERCTVEQLREGLKISGPALEFGPGNAEFRPSGIQVVARFAREMRGHTTRIEVHGHAWRESLPENGPARDLVDLSYARAKVVADVLATNGVEPHRVRLVACGDREPLRASSGAQDEDAPNRCAEIIVTEVLTDSPGGDARTHK
jgi:chemotaxis protein MotB